MQVLRTITEILWVYAVSGVVLYVFSTVSTKDKVDILTWPKYVFKPRKPQPTLNDQDLKIVLQLARAAVDYDVRLSDEVALSKQDRENLG